MKSSAFGEVLWRRQEQKGKDDVRVNHNTQTLSKRLICYLKLISNTSPTKCTHSACHSLSATLHIQTANDDIWPNKMEASSQRDAGLSVFGSCLSYKTGISSIMFSAMHELSPSNKKHILWVPHSNSIIRYIVLRNEKFQSVRGGKAFSLILSLLSIRAMIRLYI